MILKGLQTGFGNIAGKVVLKFKAALCSGLGQNGAHTVSLTPSQKAQRVMKIKEPVATLCVALLPPSTRLLWF